VVDGQVFCALFFVAQAQLCEIGDPLGPRFLCPMGVVGALGIWIVGAASEASEGPQLGGVGFTPTWERHRRFL
jgi:hypothetical protein